ncbi:protein of unknown function [Alcaligenes faecalis subsp. faecalis]|nr:protein of unknown function [Alcaligenes faecalis subsp. faecalis]
MSRSCHTGLFLATWQCNTPRAPSWGCSMKGRWFALKPLLPLATRMPSGCWAISSCSVSGRDSLKCAGIYIVVFLGLGFRINVSIIDLFWIITLYQFGAIFMDHKPCHALPTIQRFHLLVSWTEAPEPWGVSWRRSCAMR